MSSLRDEELEEFRDDALSEDARRAFRASAESTRRWERAHPLDVNAILPLPDPSSHQSKDRCP